MAGWHKGSCLGSGRARAGLQSWLQQAMGRMRPGKEGALECLVSRTLGCGGSPADQYSMGLQISSWERG